MVTFYHGSKSSHLHFNLNAIGSDGQGYLFLSLSPNVAKRYGDRIHTTDICIKNLPRIRISQWLDNKIPDAKNFIVIGENDSFDFPVDMLVIREATENSFRLVDFAECDDDGLAFREPTSADDRQWELYVKDVYDGDLDAWLEDTSE